VIIPHSSFFFIARFVTVLRDRFISRSISRFGLYQPVGVNSYEASGSARRDPSMFSRGGAVNIRLARKGDAIAHSSAGSE